LTRTRTAEEWDRALEPLGVPCGPINDFGQAFADPQAVHRGMRVSVPHPLAPTGTVDLIGNPIKFGDTPVAYRQAPPMRGEHTREVLVEKLGMDEAEIARLAEAGIADLGDCPGGDAERAA
jgi:crotonobetainyl-CoA:carnitine CoA-transferase CaiB-like acyl-CoA transferase